MDSKYKVLHEQATKLHFHFKDSCDDRIHDLSQTLIVQGKEVIEDIKRNLAPRAIESRVRDIQEILQKLKNEPESILNYNEINHQFQGYEKLRQSLRSLPNY